MSRSPYSLLCLSYIGASIVPEGNDRFGSSYQDGSVGTGPYRVTSSIRAAVSSLNGTGPTGERVIHGAKGLSLASEFLHQRFFRSSVPEGYRWRRIYCLLMLRLCVANLTSRLDTARHLASSPTTPPSTRGGGRSTTSGCVRRLVQAVDVATLVRQTLGRLAVPAHGLIPPGLLGHDPIHATRGVSGSLPPTEQLSTEIELKALLNPVFFGEYAALARGLSAAFREQKVNIRPINKTMAEWLDATSQGTADVAVGRWGADYPDAHTFVHLLHTQEGYIGRFCGSPEIDLLIEKGRAEPSPLVRHSLYRQIEEIIARDALMLPLFHEQAYRFARPEVEGLDLSYGTTVVNYANLRIRD